VIAADVAHVLHTPVSDLRRERWIDLIGWHRHARRIGKAIGIPIIDTEFDDGGTDQ